MLRAPQQHWLVDQQGRGVADPRSVIGRAGLPLRLVGALPISSKPPQPTFAAVAFVDTQGLMLQDPVAGTVLGEPPLYVHRLLAATRTIDTRGL